MYKKKNFLIPFLLLALLLSGSSVCFAQEQLSLSLNDTEVNLRTGIALDDYQQLEEVSLSLKSAGEEASPAFNEIRVYLARGARPVQMQKYLQPGQHLNITELMRHAEGGDRLVIELFDSTSSEAEANSSQVMVLALN